MDTLSFIFDILAIEVGLAALIATDICISFPSAIRECRPDVVEDEEFVAR